MNSRTIEIGVDINEQILNEGMNMGITTPIEPPLPRELNDQQMEIENIDQMNGLQLEEINIIPHQIEIQQLNDINEMNELQHMEEINGIKEEIMKQMEETPIETIQRNETENNNTEYNQIQQNDKPNESIDPFQTFHQNQTIQTIQILTEQERNEYKEKLSKINSTNETKQVIQPKQKQTKKEIRLPQPTQRVSHVLQSTHAPSLNLIGSIDLNENNDELDHHEEIKQKEESVPSTKTPSTITTTTKQTENTQTTKPNWELLKQISKTYEACQQSVLIGLLNVFGYEIGIERVYKMSKKTFPLFTICYVKHSTSQGKVDTDIISRAIQTSEEKLKTSTVSEKNKKRQHKRNLDASICNILMEYLEKEGVKFQMKGTRSAQYTTVMKKVKMIELTLFEKERLISYDEIINIGKYINNHIMKMMNGMKRKINNHDQCVVLPASDQNISKLFLNSFEGILDEFDETTKCNEIDTSNASTNKNQIKKDDSHPLEFDSFIETKTVDFIKKAFK